MRENANLTVSTLCSALSVSRSGIYRFTAGKTALRVELRLKAATLIRELFGESKSTYGYRSVRVALKRRGIALNRKTVAAIMRA